MAALASTSRTIPTRAALLRSCVSPRLQANSAAPPAARASPRRNFLTHAATTVRSERESLRRAAAGVMGAGGRGETMMMMHTSAALQHGSFKKPAPGTGLKVTFRDSTGKDIKTVEANEGDDLLTLAHAYGIDLEGACEGSVACSTCHVILDSDVYDLLEEPSDDENDMLDLAFGLTDTSRLGCQVKVTKETDGMVAQLPSATRNMYGHKPKPH
ncbi:hypothetical protein CF327_g5441 [Tilletia walkeri]|uniref:2Fe-2S ferredoxin-type domain-containing protein n=1 Tax=Tilletia walkeri TaxID=117179 RepID=A0A8X7T3C8_9BASI|nr:hypothetical protein CF327_g5441 [Tilletia walkeri]KAE8267266.1 hypothetical protein A4X09_0g5085 [Tilletia walkeri]